MKKSIPVALFLIATVLTGCASGARVWISPANDREIASEFVKWMTQDENFPFQSTTVQIRRGQGTFGNTLKANMRNSGYFIQTIPDHFVAPNLISYEAEYFERGDGRAINYSVRVGKHEVSRKYRYRSNSREWVPLDDFEVKKIGRLEKPREDELIAGTLSTKPKKTLAPVENTGGRLRIPEPNIDFDSIRPINFEQTVEPMQQGPNESNFAFSVRKRLEDLDSKATVKTVMRSNNQQPLPQPISATVAPEGIQREPQALTNDASNTMSDLEKQMLALAKRGEPGSLDPETAEPQAAKVLPPIKLSVASDDSMPKPLAEPLVKVGAEAAEELNEIPVSVYPTNSIASPEAVDVVVVHASAKTEDKGINLLGFGQPVRIRRPAADWEPVRVEPTTAAQPIAVEAPTAQPTKRKSVISNFMSGGS